MIDERLEYLYGEIQMHRDSIADIESESIESTYQMLDNNAKVEVLHRLIEECENEIDAIRQGL